MRDSLTPIWPILVERMVTHVLKLQWTQSTGIGRMRESNNSHDKVDLTLRFFHLGSTLPSVSTTSGPLLQEDESSYQVIRSYTFHQMTFFYMCQRYLHGSLFTNSSNHHLPPRWIMLDVVHCVAECLLPNVVAALCLLRPRDLQLQKDSLVLSRAQWSKSVIKDV